MSDLKIIDDAAITVMTPDDIAGVVRDLWDETRDLDFRMGRLLAQAKDQVAHGEWGAWCLANLPFGETTARALVRQVKRIDGLPDDLKAATVAVLPREYSVANQVLRLGNDALADVVKRGDITPDMTRNDAQRLVRTVEFSRAAPLPPKIESADDGELGVDLRVSLPQVIASGARFRTIVADPAWEFEAWSKHGNDKNPNRYYDTMTTEDIAALPVGEAAAGDCVLYLWVADWDLPAALRVMSAWGFEYKAKGFTWVKYWPDGPSGQGTGYWTQSGTETCYIGVRGKPARLMTGVRELVFEEKGPHSAKPEIFQDLIFDLSGGPALELYARRQKPGWMCLGNEVPFVAPPPLQMVDPEVADVEAAATNTDNLDALAAFVIESEIEAGIDHAPPGSVAAIDVDLPITDPDSPFYIPNFLSRVKDARA